MLSILTLASPSNDTDLPEPSPDPACACCRCDAARDERASAEAPLVDCPACGGFGDVPGLTHSRHNPTGLTECSWCEGAGAVTPDDAARIAARAS